MSPYDDPEDWYGPTLDGPTVGQARAHLLRASRPGIVVTKSDLVRQAAGTALIGLFWSIYVLVFLAVGYHAVLGLTLIFVIVGIGWWLKNLRSTLREVVKIRTVAGAGTIAAILPSILLGRPDSSTLELVIVGVAVPTPMFVAAVLIMRTKPS